MRNLGKHLAQEIYRARHAHPKRYSQNELASILNLHSQTISNVERGLNSLSVKHVIKLAPILDVPLSLLTDAMLRDYEDAINTEISKILAADNAATVCELRESSAG
jgi:transcriptional regulator with XRE-family HTH domain